MASSEAANPPEIRQFNRSDYTVGWITALDDEYDAAKALMDEEHAPLPRIEGDPNLYKLGRMGAHNVVLTSLPVGSIGNDAAAAVGSTFAMSFPSARLGLLVGIGGGIPSSDHDIRLGDVVVSEPDHNGNPGVVQHDFGKASLDEFQLRRHLNKPPKILLNAIREVKSNLRSKKSKFWTHLAMLEELDGFARASAGLDRLFQPTYDHTGGPTCASCEQDNLVKRDPRPMERPVRFHYGTVASGNTVMKSATERDKVYQRIRSQSGADALCFEMEAAGLMDNFPCLVIRGICDYSDSHKNDQWQPYAAATAAAYAKEILSAIPPVDLANLSSIQGTSHHEHNVYFHFPSAVDDLENSTRSSGQGSAIEIDSGNEPSHSSHSRRGIPDREEPEKSDAVEAIGAFLK